MKAMESRNYGLKYLSKLVMQFIATVASSIFGMKKEPSKEEFLQVAKQIAQKYPSVGATTNNMVSYGNMGES